MQRFEESGDYLKARHFLEAKYGVWPSESAAADRIALESHIAAQENFIQTGYYPWDELPPSLPVSDSSTNSSAQMPSGGNKSARFFCRLKDGASTLDEALASAPPSAQTPPSDQ